MLPRTLARRWLPANGVWPRVLRSKWLAVVLLGLFLWAYEVSRLGQPLVDGLDRPGLFRGGVCDRRFVSRRRFLQIRLPDRAVQFRAIADFAAGSESPRCRRLHGVPDERLHSRRRAGIPGCELNLYQPRKSSNMDCTFCLDCIHACPHDNVGILAVAPPRAELWHDPLRSGIGRFSRRTDLAALVLILVFGAFANAAGMVGPVVAVQEPMCESPGDYVPIFG